ncbi:hypothetical protein BDY21DRAFT_402422 [Lineolata rhizophorae]|uniref:GDS1 winged helix domain-containing protein n=1 Tax=Lineolata rhizophorae TaxID=578093 RepID=A0A6A6NPW2_9PEZI|nr:hypothetical protein BDY21DRAFT_402422 [Lineolata rhizophorae]
MPYNTRRKSLSLPSLGIHVPNSSRSSSHRSPPSAASATALTPATLDAAHRPPQQPPSKKVKRSHSSASASPPLASPPRQVAIRFQDERPPAPKSGGGVSARGGKVVENTPPPSPGCESAGFKVDTEGIRDEIVVAVIEQLETTANRPHLLKELAAVLGVHIPLIGSSANPTAIISSRLSNYMRRPWTALSPCPVTKQLVGSHPKRIFFFLATCPRQPFPDLHDEMRAPNAARIISPSLSSTGDSDAGSEDRSDTSSAVDDMLRRRRELSASPEVDLSSPELDGDVVDVDMDVLSAAARNPGAPVTPPGIAFDARHSPLHHLQPHHHHHNHHHGHHDGVHHGPAGAHNAGHAARHQTVPPPLETDEREFTATASSLQRQRALELRDESLRARARARARNSRPGSSDASAIAAGAGAAAVAVLAHDGRSIKMEDGCADADPDDVMRDVFDAFDVDGEGDAAAAATGARGVDGAGDGSTMKDGVGAVYMGGARLADEADDEESEARRNSEAAAALFGHVAAAAAAAAAAEEEVEAEVEEEDQRNKGAEMVVEGGDASGAGVGAKRTTNAAGTAEGVKMEMEMEIGGMGMVAVGAAAGPRGGEVEVEERGWKWAELRSPESVELRELEDMFEEF